MLLLEILFTVYIYRIKKLAYHIKRKFNKSM